MGESFEPVHAAIFARARTEPALPAVHELDDSVVTFRELCERAARFGDALARLGVGREAVVAAALPQSTDSVAAMLGILGRGACYLPVDPLSPWSRTATMLLSVGTQAIVTDRPNAAGLAAITPASLRGEALPLEGPPDIHPEQLAYLIFTSGSTGLPKGVAMPHRGLSRLIAWQRRSIAERPRTLAFAPAGFDVSLQEQLSTLASGGTLILCGEPARQDPARLLDRVRSTAADHLFMPPSALHRLASEALRQGRLPISLRHVITAGEPLVVTHAIRRFFAELPGTRLDNHYGPTEAHLVTAYTLEGDSSTWPDAPPIGGPVTGVSVRILPAGPDGTEPGELHVGGMGVARGYRCDPRRTAERFVPDPVGSGGLLYRTGDLARVLPCGSLEFAGRVDAQMKVRGFRVEPAEVERALCALPAVAEAAVGMRRVAEDVSVLVAYLVAVAGERPDARQLVLALGGSLPEYMVPVRFLLLPALPRTASGKIDRAALADLPLDAAAGEPATGGSAIGLVRAVWERVLGHRDFDDDEDFFDVGGDSLLAVWAAGELSRAAGREVSLSMFLDAATVDSMAAELALSAAPSARARSGSELLTLRAGPPSRLLFLFHALGGEVLAYREFARALSTPVRLLGVRMAPEARGSGLTLKELAAAHVEEIVALEPHGPYRLAGWSFGGALAHEVACQLRARGEAVSFLGLIDANPALDPVCGDLRGNDRHIREIDGLLARLRESATAAEVRFEARDGIAGLLGAALPEGLGPAELADYLAATRASLAAAQSHEPAVCDCSITLFQAGATAPDLQHRLHSALRALAGGGLVVHRIDASHFTMLRPPAVAELARCFDAALRASLAGEELAA